MPNERAALLDPRFWAQAVVMVPGQVTKDLNNVKSHTKTLLQNAGLQRGIAKVDFLPMHRDRIYCHLTGTSPFRCGSSL